MTLVHPSGYAFVPDRAAFNRLKLTPPEFSKVEPSPLFLSFSFSSLPVDDRSQVCMPHTLNPTSNCPLRLSCALRLATYALSCPRSLYVRRPTLRSITQGLRYPCDESYTKHELVNSIAHTCP